MKKLFIFLSLVIIGFGVFIIFKKSKSVSAELEEELSNHLLMSTGVIPELPHEKCWESAHPSFLVVLNAKNFEEMGRAQVPQVVPAGLHGQYFNDILTKRVDK